MITGKTKGNLAGFDRLDNFFLLWRAPGHGEGNALVPCQKCDSHAQSPTAPGVTSADIIVCFARFDIIGGGQIRLNFRCHLPLTQLLDEVLNVLLLHLSPNYDFRLHHLPSLIQRLLLTRKGAALKNPFLSGAELSAVSFPGEGKVRAVPDRSGSVSPRRRCLHLLAPALRPF